MDIYLGGRQSGKTTKLIQMSAETGAIIVVGTYPMAKYVMSMAINMGLEIPEPISYKDLIKRAHYDHLTRRYLIDEAQMLFDWLNVNAVTITTDGHICELKGVEPNGGK